MLTTKVTFHHLNVQVTFWKLPFWRAYGISFGNAFSQLFAHWRGYFHAKIILRLQSKKDFWKSWGKKRNKFGSEFFFFCCTNQTYILLQETNNMVNMQYSSKNMKIKNEKSFGKIFKLLFRIWLNWFFNSWLIIKNYITTGA